MNKLKLPEKLTVEVKKLPKGKLFATILELQVFTEVENEGELLEMVNDLIYCYYDIPKSLRRMFYYEPLEDSDYKKNKTIMKKLFGHYELCKCLNSLGFQPHKQDSTRHVKLGKSKQTGQKLRLTIRYHSSIRFQLSVFLPLYRSFIFKFCQI